MDELLMVLSALWMFLPFAMLLLPCCRHCCSEGVSRLFAARRAESSFESAEDSSLFAARRAESSFEYRRLWHGMRCRRVDCVHGVGGGSDNGWCVGRVEVGATLSIELVLAQVFVVQRRNRRQHGMRKALMVLERTVLIGVLVPKVLTR